MGRRNILLRKEAGKVSSRGHAARKLTHDCAIAAARSVKTSKESQRRMHKSNVVDEDVPMAETQKSTNRIIEEDWDDEPTQLQHSSPSVFSSSSY